MFLKFAKMLANFSYGRVNSRVYTVAMSQHTSDNQTIIFMFVLHHKVNMLSFIFELTAEHLGQ